MTRSELIQELAARGLKLDRHGAIKSRSGNTRLKVQKLTAKIFTRFWNGRANEWLSIGSCYFKDLAFDGKFLGVFTHYMGTAKKINLEKF